MKLILLGLILVLLSGCCRTFCKPVYIPVPVPPVKVKLESNLPCDLTTNQSSDAEVIRIMMKCITTKNGYIKDMQIRLEPYIEK